MHADLLQVNRGYQVKYVLAAINIEADATLFLGQMAQGTELGRSAGIRF